ncbi:hypothetical protein K505DRAFT_331884 [Melanomma pulvis-pyrius CBS 109.77]|uniref:Uncharacterized protein n=1 Tax=Melanomma pulvis-pyrius CBS 109.77 TaxID=1314802 RepID=A0A6A6XUM5_9PLEO|nr:hypothetical protein K505DRAFT_331884 [Melanomma pulvis-pyrius CBS 109.77]
MAHAPSTDVPDSGAHVVGCEVIRIHQIWRHGTVISVEAFVCKSRIQPHIPCTSELIFYEARWPEFEQLPGALDALDKLEYGLHYRIRKAASQPLPSSAGEIFFKCADPTPDGYRIMLHEKPLPETKRLYQVTRAYRLGDDYHVEAKVFESSNEGHHPVQGMIIRSYIWSEFEATEFERTTEYDEEFSKAQCLLEALQDSDKGWVVRSMQVVIGHFCCSGAGLQGETA